MDDDRLRDALRDLQRAAMPLMSPPGVDRVRSAVRRRRATRATLGSVMIMLLAVTGILALPTTPPPPTIAPTTSASVPSASAPPSVTASAAATTTAAASSRAGQGGGPTIAQACINAEIGSLYNAGYVTVRYTPDGTSTKRCAKVRFFWASYTLGTDGVARRYASNVFYVSAANPSIRFFIDAPPCSSAWYVVIGDFAIKSTFPAPKPDATYDKTNGDIQPYEGSERGYQLHWDVTDPCPASETPTVSPS